MNDILTNPDVVAAFTGLLSVALTAAIAIGTYFLKRLTGVALTKQHQDSLHKAMISGVESALLHGPGAGIETIKAHALAHVRQSVPDAVKALIPGNGVLDTIAERYIREALSRLPDEARA